MNAEGRPEGVVTFLFTDIEGSTRRWEADAEAMRAALEAHDTLLRSIIEDHLGWLFKHTGDGVCAAFSSPTAAVDAAVAAQRKLDLPVRMGIATGEAELRGSDYFGAVLNRAARVMAAGHGGQTLLDGQTAGLLAGADLADLGSRRLRDIAHPIELFQVRAEGLRTEFPPLRTLDPTPGNLRRPVTSLIGRDSEVADVEATLRGHRLVTLTGVGGVGKTRLAVEVASRVANTFPDGVWLIELAAVSDPGAVPDAVASVLGVKQQPGMTLADSVAQALEGRTRLLVFDNCEHVLDAAGDIIEAILERSATVKILATSREGLRVGDEQLWTVPSLEAQGAGSTAAALFAERAHSVAQNISLDRPDEAAAVDEICRRLDGIPLGIELAASRMQSMTATEVRDRLDDRFRFLVGSRRGLERHQTLRHAVQWSYDLLGEDEKVLLTRCSAFVGGFDLDAAVAVGGIGDDLGTLDLLDALVRKSLLIAERSSGRTRFSMLETIRQFADEQLVASGSADATRLAHSRYFGGRESDVLARWASPRQLEAYEWFNLELPNLRSAFRWAADNGDLDSAAAIAVYAAFLGYSVEHYEAIAWAEELIQPAEAVQHRRLAQLYVGAAQCSVTGRIEDFLRYADAAQKAIASGRFDDVRDGFDSISASGYIHAGQPERCVEWCRNSIDRHPDGHELVATCLVVALTFTGGDDEALAASDRLLAIASDTDVPNLACFALLGYGWAQRNANPDAAYDALQEGLKVAQDSGNRQIVSSITILLSRLAVARHDAINAFDFLGQTIRHYHDAGSVSYLRGPLALLTVLLNNLELRETAAIISGFGATMVVQGTFPEFDVAVDDLREALGGDLYDSLADVGARMSNAEMVSYAFDQIDRTRAELSP